MFVPQSPQSVGSSTTTHSNDNSNNNNQVKLKEKVVKFADQAIEGDYTAIVSSPDLIGHIANWKQFTLGFGATFLHVARFALL